MCIRDRGIGKVKVTASAGKETAMDEVELDIRNPNPIINKVQEVTLLSLIHI